MPVQATTDQKQPDQCIYYALPLLVLAETGIGFLSGWQIAVETKGKTMELEQQYSNSLGLE